VRALLDDRSSLEAELVVTGIDKLWILPDGRSANYSGFSAAKLTALLEEVKRKFDYVIVDSAAVNRNADAASMAACFDRTVIVVRAGVTRSPVVAKSVNELRRAGARIAGVVLNRREFVIPEIIYRQL
jgi:Mrp family chromosome partitioning ATPase